MMATTTTTRGRLLLLLLLTHCTAITCRDQPYRGRPCDDDHGRCKPSFLIIGVGKCGTSSLYYYLTDHPSVKAAAQKQIQWFDHQYSASRFNAYLDRSFPHHMEPGEMTGEASPGYAQYSEVPVRVAKHLPETRVLVIVRDPAERAYSAYHYNYLNVVRPNKKRTFEFLIEHETRLLAKCLENNSENKIDLSRDCYGRTTAKDTYGVDDMPLANQHLWRQLVGRSLYILYLDWWPEFFMVCSELLAAPETAADEMATVAAYLGLPTFDFRPVVDKGKYNAGAKHLGYGKVTPWDQAEKLADLRPPMTAAARHLIDTFAHPHTTRLFERANRSCPKWGSSRRLDDATTTLYSPEDPHALSSSSSSSATKNDDEGTLPRDLFS
ncbi:hypothetical protein CTAYLR_003253 [Chrysophaeum taylorii]|uniref:Sulfotransferase domain-containing protein n=1 Tax=Chrysophaeum taylorii TaxID=2483200 RepID=A0AAD7XK27_9STRA|nr:hypothetical protein CTAYLR_003253 [Chrysophaeum taylorii]